MRIEVHIERLVIEGVPAGWGGAAGVGDAMSRALAEALVLRESPDRSVAVDTLRCRDVTLPAAGTLPELVRRSARVLAAEIASTPFAQGAAAQP